VKQQYPGLPVYVMGHSMGALIATHLGLGHFAGDAAVKGFILSSPYYVNAIKVSPVLLALSGVLGALAPRMKVPLASLTHQLTHDSASPHAITTMSATASAPAKSRSALAMR
jgi:alpha-beta hydrolase superfamily lysophospholipase